MEGGCVMTGTAFAIEEFSIYDGPGIRTTVFLKGCPLRCSWCHNPEGQKREPEVIKSPNGCTGCGNCIKYAAVSEGKMVFGEESIKNCPNNLLRRCGTEYGSGELCEIILKNEKILNHGGGVTFSGGEPLWQHDFLTECLVRLKGRVNTAVQTSGYCAPDKFDRVLDAADMFLFDLKLADNRQHIKYTGMPNLDIKENYRRLAASGKTLITRIPLIPGVTDTEENINAIAAFMAENNVFYAELMPYNKLAGSKYKAAGREYRPDFDPETEPQPRREIFGKAGIEIKIL